MSQTEIKKAIENLGKEIKNLTEALRESSKQASLYNLILGILTAIITVLTGIMVCKLFFP